VYGPYQAIGGGQYVADFHIAPIELPDDDNEVVAILDVARDPNAAVIAVRRVSAGELRSGERFFPVEFATEDAAVVEIRVAIFGNARLEIDDYVPWYPVDGSLDPVSICEKNRFPAINSSSPALLRDAQRSLRKLRSFGFIVSMRGDEIVLQKDGIQFFVHSWDDMNLVEEIFIDDIYRFDLNRGVVVIDVGMNIGLVSMRFAQKPSVAKVYSFEPFEATYQRAMNNLSLNPTVSAKIEADNAGISTADGVRVFSIFENADSGSQSMRDVEGGIPVEMKMRDAASVFKKAIEEAELGGLAVVAKVDCEGGEFEIIARLAESGLLNRVTAVMVEWHRVFKGRTQADLINPLKDAGFLVFDRTRVTGNGFFYAVRAA
jgi:FkbM family methyltransferase